MDKTFSPSYFSSQITYVEAEAVEFSRLRFHRKRTASASTSLLGIFCKISFPPAVTSYYQVHALNADAQLSAALLCYFKCKLCRNLAAVNCMLHWIVLTLFTLQMDITLVIVRSCITLLWLHRHNHKMSMSYHKNGLVSNHESVSRWFIFMCFVVRIFWYFDETSWLSTAYLSLCQDRIRGWNHFAFIWIKSVNRGGAGGEKPLKFFLPLEKFVGHSLKLLDIV